MLILILLRRACGGIVYGTTAMEEIVNPQEKNEDLKDAIIIKKGKKDKYKYRYFRLDNEAKVILVQGDDLERSAAAIFVDVGGCEDPVGSEGLAHFLEHMLFMGSEKHPEESGFTGYISRKGGVYDAYTLERGTIFLYEVASEAFEESLDAFSGFFTLPLIRNDSVEREVNAVDNENSGYISITICRINRLLGELRKEGSELGRFLTGSKNTLFGDDLRERVYEFWKRKYSAEKFCIVLGGNQGLDVLEGYARKYFKDLPVREKEEKEDSEIGYFHYDEKYTGKLIRMRIESLSSEAIVTESLVIVITIPESVSAYKDKVHSYIEFLLKIAKKGGFIHTIKSNGYASEVGVLVDRKAFNNEIKILIDLLPKGQERISEIKGLLKDYLKILRENTCEEAFNELKKGFNSRLEYASELPILQQAMQIAINGSSFPAEDVVIGEMPFGDYNDDKMKETLDIMLNDEKWIHIYLTTSGPFNRTEEHYGIDYGVTEYHTFDESSEEYRKASGSMRWPFGKTPDDTNDNEIDKDLPHQKDVTRKIIVLDDVKCYKFEELREDAEEYLKEKGVNGEVTVGPSQMRIIRPELAGDKFSCDLKNKYGELKYAVSNSICGKYVSLDIAVSTDDHIGDISQVAKCRMHFDCFLSEFMDKYKDDINLLFVSLEVTNDGRVLEFKANGPYPGVYALAELFFREYRDSSTRYTEDSIASGIRKVKETYMKELAEPFYEILKLGILRELNCVGFRYKDMLESYSRIKDSDEPVKIEKGYMRFTISGGGAFKDSVDLYRKIREYVEGEEISTLSAFSEDEVVYIETGDKINNVVGIFQDLGPSTDKEMISMGVLAGAILQDKFHDQIRTKECLAYKVIVSPSVIGNTNMFCYVVQSNKEPENIQKSIENFMNESYRIVEEMVEEDFIDYVDNVVKIFENPKNFYSYSMVYHMRWTLMEFKPKTNTEMSLIIGKIKKEDVVEFLKKNHKRIVVYSIHDSKRK